LRVDRERHIHGHLIAVQIRIVRGADQRMDADGFAFDQLRLKSLDRQPMQGRRAIEQHRMTLSDFLENVPNFRRLALDHFFRTAHRMDITEIFDTTNNEWLEQNDRHLLRQTATVTFQFVTYDHTGVAASNERLDE